MRANLASRAAELEASGVAPADAARRAVDELGDVRALLAETTEPAPARARTDGYGSMAQAALAHKVRPRPAFVVSLVITAATTAALLVLVYLGIIGVIAAPVGALVGWILGAGLGGGWIVGSSVAQETTTKHPVPAGRAAGYGSAAGLVVVGVGLVGIVVTGGPPWLTIIAAPPLVSGVGLFAGLGATQTNREKAWVRQAAREHGRPGDRFSRDPEAAARFGILAGVIWVSAFVGFVVVGMAAGWEWSWLTFVVGWIGFMLLLAKMLFGGAGR
ncbi:hypothetical protein [Isoptericola halotolerans]|uniref:hypothetical protein n=1 Tax=Isoptericola halotolerans TaxID=300560 RepID=UPI0035BE44BE